ncbi:MAG: hypothetical protein WAZ77_06315 [Candidatus Nitrosopolaris sp.]
MWPLVSISTFHEEVLSSLLKLHQIVEKQGMGENEVISVLKLANNNELPYLQDKVEYLKNEINNLELEKAECTNHVLTLSKRIDFLTETGNMYDSSLNEKMEQIAFLNREQKRLDNHFTNNNGNKNDEGIEIF